MRKVANILFLALIFIPFISANAGWEDYGEWYGGIYGNGCKSVSNESLCKPPLLPPDEGQNLTCYYYPSTQGCCCEGLVWVPNAPVVETTVIGNTIHLQWNADKTADGYSIWWSTSPVIEMNSSHYIHPTGNSYYHTNLNYNTEYWYVVRAYNTYGGNSRYVYGGKTGPLPLPSAPRLSASQSGGKIVLSWTAAGDRYNVYYSTQLGVTKALYEQSMLGISGTSIAPEALTPGKTYYFVVAAENSYGEGPISNEVSESLVIDFSPIFNLLLSD